MVCDGSLKIGCGMGVGVLSELVHGGEFKAHFGARLCAKKGRKKLAENPVVFKALIR
jgi:hypothetical protein